MRKKTALLVGKRPAEAGRHFNDGDGTRMGGKDDLKIKEEHMDGAGIS